MYNLQCRDDGVHFVLSHLIQPYVDDETDFVLTFEMTKIPLTTAIGRGRTDIVRWYEKVYRFPQLCIVY